MLSNNDKLSKIRSLLKKNDIQYYIVPHSDEYQNEFLPEYSKRLEWISNFSGSAAVSYTHLRAHETPEHRG